MLFMIIVKKMNELQWPEFKTADFMEDDGEWFQFETPTQRAVQV